MEKIVTKKIGNKFCRLEVTLENGRLAICGVYGSVRRGLISEEAGQIPDRLKKWFPEVEPFLKWHLNDMHAGCEHQEAEGWHTKPIDPTKPTNAYGRFFKGQTQNSWNMLAWVRPDEHPEGLLGKPCPTCGYGYGTGWTKRELPPEVITWFEAIQPDAKVEIIRD